jgi:hypothetical protein
MELKLGWGTVSLGFDSGVNNSCWRVTTAARLQPAAGRTQAIVAQNIPWQS